MKNKREPSGSVKKRGLKGGMNKMSELTTLTYRQLVGMFRKNPIAFFMLLDRCIFETQNSINFIAVIDMDIKDKTIRSDIFNKLSSMSFYNCNLILEFDGCLVMQGYNTREQIEKMKQVVLEILGENGYQVKKFKWREV